MHLCVRHLLLLNPRILHPKKDNPIKDTICHQCGEVGHWRMNCPVYLTELLKKKKLSQGASTSGIFTIELYSFPSTSWVYDTGCGTHICITTQGLRGSRKLKPGALSLYVGDGHRAAVEAIGEYHLCLPSGLVLILDNFHYAPSITRGINLVSRLYKDGFINRFKNDNSISVSRNNLVYFCAIPRDDIYVIDLSSFNTNDSSMYVVNNKRAKLNLDSSLLWHCRLEHISKKRVEKFQHDGLLNSTDIKSFEKCVSCMSGKMARKYYLHQVERVKDLLRLIHTDDYALEFSVRILNMVPTKNVNKTPYKVWHGKAPRTRRAPDRMCLHVDAEDHELGDLGVPANYKAALLDPESDKWLDAMNVEMQSMKDNKTFKARLVAKGFTQTYGVDYEETFSPIVDIRAIRILIAIAAFYDYEIWQMDVKTAFLNGHLFEEVYIVKPEEKLKLSKSQGASTPAEKKHMQNVPYASTVGSIVYAVRCTRPDVAFAQNIKSQFQQNPSELHWTSSSRFLATLMLDISDADDLKSQIGYVFVLNGGVIDWKSTKQSIFATSSTEAEYIAAYDASKKAVWIQIFIFRLGIVPIIEEL
ncbi:retrotransposon protein, putative, ty1-copia subclass [Tanacetum coccineum]